MSIKPILNDIAAKNNKSINLYANTFNGTIVNADILTAKTGDGNTLNYSTPDQGNLNYSLHTDGAGSTFWAPDDTGSADITYAGTLPVSIGQHIIFKTTNAKEVEQSAIIESGTSLDIGVLDIITTGNVSANKSYCELVKNGSSTTPIITAGVYELITGLFNQGLANNFTGSTSPQRITYDGILTKIFRTNIDMSFNANSGSNKVYQIAISKNGIVQTTSQQVLTSDNTTTVHISTSKILELSTNDYIDVRITNLTDTTPPFINRVMLNVSEI